MLVWCSLCRTHTDHTTEDHPDDDPKLGPFDTWEISYDEAIRLGLHYCFYCDQFTDHVEQVCPEKDTPKVDAIDQVFGEPYGERRCAICAATQHITKACPHFDKIAQYICKECGSYDHTTEDHEFVTGALDKADKVSKKDSTPDKDQVTFPWIIGSDDLTSTKKAFVTINDEGKAVGIKFDDPCLDTGVIYKRNPYCWGCLPALAHGSSLVLPVRIPEDPLDDVICSDCGIVLYTASFLPETFWNSYLSML